MENKTLGQMIGKCIDNFAITNDSEDKVQIKLTFDYSTASDSEIKSWLNGNRRIALQRPARAMSKVELNDLNDTTIFAIDAGKKVKTRAEKLSVYIAMGLPKHIAELAIDEPAKFKEVMDSMSE